MCVCVCVCVSAHTFTPICSSRGAVVRRVDLFSDFMQSLQAAGFFRGRVDGALGHMGSPLFTQWSGLQCDSELWRDSLHHICRAIRGYTGSECSML